MFNKTHSSYLSLSVYNPVIMDLKSTVENSQMKTDLHVGQQFSFMRHSFKIKELNIDDPRGDVRCVYLGIHDGKTETYFHYDRLIEIINSPK